MESIDCTSTVSNEGGMEVSLSSKEKEKKKSFDSKEIADSIRHLAYVLGWCAFWLFIAIAGRR